MPTKNAVGTKTAARINKRPWYKKIKLATRYKAFRGKRSAYSEQELEQAKREAEQFLSSGSEWFSDRKIPEPKEKMHELVRKTKQLLDKKFLARTHKRIAFAIERYAKEPTQKNMSEVIREISTAAEKIDLLLGQYRENLRFWEQVRMLKQGKKELSPEAIKKRSQLLSRKTGEPPTRAILNVIVRLEIEYKRIKEHEKSLSRTVDSVEEHQTHFSPR